ncbi:MAG TPA: helix-turn-helix transcriptional regulator [Clostridiaceae bacterium]|nr:helix-turn-helix transcriptional regulator [Clostridiaceae bacterium]
MINNGIKLKTVMDYFDIGGNQLAKALDVDPSLVSRWLSGKRKLRAASAQMDALAEYILAQSRSIDDIKWLNAHFESEGLPTELSSVHRIKQNLVVWLASDGDSLRRNLGGNTPDMGRPQPVAAEAALTCPARHSSIRLGVIQIALDLEPLFASLSPQSRVDIFLSSDRIATIAQEDISGLIIRAIEKSRLQIRLVVCVSGDTQAISRLIDVYMKPLVSGHIRLLLLHGMTQTVTNQMHLIIPDGAVMLVTETPGVAAPPVALIVTDRSFVEETQKSFEQTVRYAQPALQVYSDDYSRNILEILYMEYATPGSLDVVKDSLNPLYMTQEAYDRALLALGHEGAEFAWRSAEFARFKAGMDGVLGGDSVFREILSLSRLMQVARDGFCRMPGLYFMKKGFVNLNAEGCAAILNGYIRYLESVPNFHLLILDDLSALHAGSCWHIKRNASMAANCWSGEEPLMIHTNQILIVNEFQSHFDVLWAQSAGSIGNRSGMIAILRDVVALLTKNHLMK